MTTAQPAGKVLGELSLAGVPWLAIDMSGAGLAGARPLAMSAASVTILDLADPHAVPVMVNPLEPAPGYPVQAHADRLGGLFEAAFGLSGMVTAAIRAGLRRTYADCGWDMVTGSAAPGAVTSPAVPLYRQFRNAVIAAAEDLGYSQDAQAGVRGFLQSRLDALWAGPAGTFLQGGHPADAISLLRADVLVTNSGLADDEAASFLAGVLLVRLAEQLRPRPPCRPGRAQPGVVVVIGLIQQTAWFGRLLGDIRSAGTDVIVVPGAGGRAGVAGVATSEGATGAKDTAVFEAAEGVTEVTWAHGAERCHPADGATPVLLGRRSAACGERCRRRPCDGYEVHAAGLLARENQQAWLRLWVQTLVLAFLTGRPVPCVPGPLRSGWPRLSPRRRDCLLATLVDAAVTARASALRPSYDPRRLTSVVAMMAARMLQAAGPGDVLLPGGAVLPAPASPVRAGQVWVIPPLRWLHEIERVNQLGQGGVRLDDVAPPLDFGLAGLSDWPGIRVRDRLAGLRRHPLSMESACHRELATIALLGEDGGAGLEEDLASTSVGLSPRQRLRHAARILGVEARGQEPSWLEVVLSWPDQISRAAGNSDVRRTANR